MEKARTKDGVHLARCVPRASSHVSCLLCVVALGADARCRARAWFPQLRRGARVHGGGAAADEGTFASCGVAKHAPYLPCGAHALACAADARSGVRGAQVAGREQGARPLVSQRHSLQLADAVVLTLAASVPRAQKVERLSASLHLVGARPAGKRTVFVEDGCGRPRSCFARTISWDERLTRHRRSEEALAVMPGAAAGGVGDASDEDASDSEGEGGRDAHAPQSARGCVPPAAARPCRARQPPGGLLRELSCADCPWPAQRTPRAGAAARARRQAGAPGGGHGGRQGGAGQGHEAQAGARGGGRAATVQVPHGAQEVSAGHARTHDGGVEATVCRCTRRASPRARGGRWRTNLRRDALGSATRPCARSLGRLRLVQVGVELLNLAPAVPVPHLRKRGRERKTR